MEGAVLDAAVPTLLRHTPNWLQVAASTYTESGHHTAECPVLLSVHALNVELLCWQNLP